MLMTLVLLGLVVSGAFSAASLADHVDSKSGDDWFDVSAYSQEESGGLIDAAATESAVTYSYTPTCIRGEGLPDEDFYGCGDQMECGDRGHVFNVYAHHADGSIEALGSQCFEPSEAPVAAAELTATDVLRAFRRIPVPASEVAIQPPGGKTLVNLDTVLATRAEPFSRTVGLLGHRVELDITPAEFRWVHGDGTVQLTDWPGKPWRQGTPLHELITHRYQQADPMVRPRVDTTWTARYRVDGGPWRDVGGSVVITGEPSDLTVLSAAPHLSG